MFMTMDSQTESLCFVENAKAFQSGKISTDAYFGNMVAHFSGTKHHPSDDIEVDQDLYEIDKIGDSVRKCLWQPTFRLVKETTALKTLLVVCWKGQLPGLKSQYVTLAESPECSAVAGLLLPTLAYISCLRNYPAILQYCLSVVKDPELILKLNPSIGQIALERPHPEILDILLSTGWCAGDMRSLIYKATEMDGQRGIMLLKYALSHGAQGATEFLGKVANDGNLEVLRVLLEYSAPREIDESGALGMAVISGSDPIEKTKILLDKGVDIDYIPTKKAYSRDPIQAYTERYSWGDWDGTALHRAADFGRKDLVRLLLDRGAKTNIKDTVGKYAMDRASKLNDHAIRDMIWKASNGELPKD